MEQYQEINDTCHESTLRTDYFMLFLWEIYKLVFKIVLKLLSEMTMIKDFCSTFPKIKYMHNNNFNLALTSEAEHRHHL